MEQNVGETNGAAEHAHPRGRICETLESISGRAHGRLRTSPEVERYLLCALVVLYVLYEETAVIWSWRSESDSIVPTRRDELQGAQSKRY